MLLAIFAVPFVLYFYSGLSQVLPTGSVPSERILIIEDVVQEFTHFGRYEMLL